MHEYDGESRSALRQFTDVPAPFGVVTVPYRRPAMLAVNGTTAEERTRIQEAARCYVREQAPTPPLAVLERVARIVWQARSLELQYRCEDGTSRVPGKSAAA